MVVPFFDAKRQLATIRPEIDAAVKRVLDSGMFVLGPEGTAFEAALADYIGMKFGVGVNSATDAIKIALRALGVGAGDEVVTVANTAVPTVSAIRETGATVRFVDTDDYFCMDSNKLEKAVTKKTKAAIVVHLYGGTADITAIMKIAKKYKIKVIEDCAQATGATVGTRKVGSFGDISCFSFYPTKNLGAYGDGGMILTNSKPLADACKSLRMYGMKKTYHAEREGYNSRLDELQAAILRAKLAHLNQWNTRRQEIADYYAKHITNKKVTLPAIRPGTSHVFHLYVVRSTKRKALREHLKAGGIGAAIHYEFPIHTQKGYQFLKIKKGSLPNTEKGAQEILSLPIFPELTVKELEAVVHAIDAF